MQKFKSTPLGFLMSVIAKYQANMERKATYKDPSTQEEAKKAQEVMKLLQKSLEDTDSLKKEVSDEAILMHVIENLDQDKQVIILDCVFNYLNLLDTALPSIDLDSLDGKEIQGEYYDVSRLGLILNCYLGKFDNEDCFYGSIVDMTENAKLLNLSPELMKVCQNLTDKVLKASIDLSFKNFLEDFLKGLETPKDFYTSIVLPYADTLLSMALMQEIQEEDITKLCLAKQIQRMCEILLRD